MSPKAKAAQKSTEIRESIFEVQNEIVAEANALRVLAQLARAASEQNAEFCADVMTGLGCLIEKHTRALLDQADRLDQLWLKSVRPEGGLANAAPRTAVSTNATRVHRSRATGK